MKVSDVAKEEGGDKCIITKYESSNWITVPLKFNGYIMTIDLRTPTEEEILSLRVNWLTLPIDK